VTGRGLGMTGRVRSVAVAVWRGTLGLRTGTFGRSWDRRVQSNPREATKHARSIRRGGTSGHDRPNASGREWVLTRIDRTLALWRPVSTSGTSSQPLSSASIWRLDARARPISFDRRVRSL
jgi:hypothetical protein